MREACARNRTFLWMGVMLVGFCAREDLWGVTSLIRALGLDALYYDRLLDFFHSAALDVDALTRLWAGLVVSLHPGLVMCNGRYVVLGDGIKVGKAGKKMPGVKRLHQSSASHTKPEYILGHSCQAVAILAQGLSSIVAIPLAAHIHEGLVFSNRDKRTLLGFLRVMVANHSPRHCPLRSRRRHRAPQYTPHKRAGGIFDYRRKSQSLAHFGQYHPHLRRLLENLPSLFRGQGIVLVVQNRMPFIAFGPIVIPAQRLVERGKSYADTAYGYR